MKKESEVQAAICGALHRLSRNREGFARKVDELVEQYGSDIYPMLFFTAAHLEFGVKAARNHWNRILRHWADMNGQLHKDVDLRIVLLDYFIDVSKRMKNPKIIEIKIFQKTLQETFVDELTQLYNYRYFVQTLRREILRADRYDTPLSLVMYDVDDFKHYNDVNGHLAGSKALKKLAGIIVQGSRDVDIVSRYGGEEFAVILPETEGDGALAIAERTREKIGKTRFPKGEEQPLGRVTVSGGLAVLNVDAKAALPLIGKADQALYRAKALGKNRISAYGRERRRFERVNSTVGDHLSVVSKVGETYEARNISAGGILFRSAAAVDPGTRLRLSLDFRNGRSQIPFTALVRRVTALEENKRYEIGASFSRVRPQDREAIRDFVGSLSPL